MIYLIAHLIFNGNSYGQYRVKESMSLIAECSKTINSGGAETNVGSTGCWPISSAHQCGLL